MRTYLIAAGLLLAATQFASAQAPGTSTTIPVASATSARFIKLGEDAKLSSSVVGLKVFNNNKEDVGKIKDVAMDANGVRAYILSVGGFLGMRTHYVAVVPSQITVSYDAKDKKWHATMNATKDELKSAPEFKYEGIWNASKG